MNSPHDIASVPLVSPRSSPRELLPLCAAVFLGFSTIGLPLPALPGFVRGTLGFDALVVSLVLAAQSVATLATRHTAGLLADHRGARRAVTLGLAVSAVAGAIYLGAALTSNAVGLSLPLLLLGRVVLGLGESLLITGALSWGVGLVGRERAGLVMAWNGIAMYSALALGAPLGALLFERFSFVGSSLGALFAPLTALLFLPMLRGVPAAGGKRIAFHRIATMIGRPGLGLALSTLGFGVISAFGPLVFQERGWTRPEHALLAFGGAFVLARIFFGNAPDRFGGQRVALVCLSIELVGQLLLWLSPVRIFAVVGAAFTGIGYSLTFTSLGVEAVRRAPAENRGAAMGGYVAFFDVALGALVPLAGLLVRFTTPSSAYLLGAVAAALGIALTLGLTGEKAG